MRGTSETQISIFLPTFWFLGSIVPEILYAIFPTSCPVRSTGVPASNNSDISFYYSLLQLTGLGSQGQSSYLVRTHFILDYKSQF